MPGFSLFGVNLSGAEYDPGGTLEGTNYTYPTDAEIDYYASKGMTVIRLPFLLERVEPVAGGPLSTTELGYIDSVVDYAASKGIDVILDPHDFGDEYGTMIGTMAASNATFANFWGELAGHFASTSNVLFGLMNEPNAVTATQWLASANAAIAAIRAAGATTQQILVPGTDWDGADQWASSGNAQVLGSGIVDPSHNFAFEVHQYLDAGGSGTSSTVVSTAIGVDRLTAITEWAEATGNKLFLGEFGVASDPTSLTALNNMLGYMAQHTDVWEGGTYWAGGSWLGNYMYSVEPTNGVDKPQMGVLEQYVQTQVTIDIPPVVSASDVTATKGQSIAAANLFSVTDAAGYQTTVDAFIDNVSSASSGHFVFNGVTEPAGQYFFVPQSELSEVSFVAGAPGSVDNLSVNVFDGTDWGNGVTFQVNVAADIPPVVSASNVTATPGQYIAASNLFSVADPNGYPITVYAFEDSTSSASSGHFVFNGVTEPSGQYFFVPAAELSEVSFVAGAPGSVDTLSLNALDGIDWGNGATFQVSVPAQLLSGSIQIVQSGGTASGTTVYSGAYQAVETGGTASGTMLDGGSQYDFGAANGTTVNSGSSEAVETGGTASATTIGSGAYQAVETGGTASGTTLDGGSLYDFGSANSTTVNSGGSETVETGGTASSTTVNSGAYQVVETGGTASGTTVSTGAYQAVETGGAASDTTLDGGSLYDFGSTNSTTINSGGSEAVETGGTASGTTLSGGSEIVMSGGTANGTITFAGSGQLTLDEATNVNNFQISGFNVPSDKLDLADISFGAQTTVAFSEATNKASGTLTVSDGVHTANITLLGQYVAQDFTSASDGSGGTIVYDPPTTSQPPMATDAADTTTHIIGSSTISGSAGLGSGQVVVDNGATLTLNNVVASAGTITNNGTVNIANNSVVNIAAGTGQDNFVFAPNFGQATLTHFVPGTDSIQIDHTVFASLDALFAAIHDNAHGNAVITDAAHDTITVQNITTAQLLAHQGDFHLV